MTRLAGRVLLIAMLGGACLIGMGFRAARADPASPAPGEAFVFLVQGVSFPDLLPLPDGVALLSGGASLPDQLREHLPAGASVRVVDLGSLEAPPLREHPGVPVVEGDALLSAWDRIRAELAEEGVLLEDGPQGTTWRRG